jgi:hypothetical protein
MSAAMIKEGVYLFKDGNGKVLYVGKSGNIKSRMKNHNHLPVEVYEQKKSVEFREESDPVKRDSLESRMILKHNPPFNQRGNTVFCKFNEVPETILSAGRTLYKCQYPTSLTGKIAKNDLVDWGGESGIRRYCLRRIPASFRYTTEGNCWVYSTKEGVQLIEKLMLNKWRRQLCREFIRDMEHGVRFEPLTEKESIDSKIYYNVQDTIDSLIKEEFEEINPVDVWAFPRKGSNKTE